MAEARLDADSLLWKIASDWRSGLSGISAGLLQLMDPGLGAGVEYNSAFFDEPYDRIYRSVPQIWATIFADDADERGTQIRDYHRDIKGVDEHGRSYHALKPDTFWWAHATFTWEMFRTADVWDRRTLAGDKRAQLYDETVLWYRRYGVSERPVPVDVGAFEDRFDQLCRTRLEMTPAAERAVEMALHDRVPAGLPGIFGDLASRVVTPVARVVALGTLPPVVRKRFDIPWSRTDAREYRAVVAAVRRAGSVIPHRVQQRPFLAAVRHMKRLATPHPDAAA